MSSTGAAPSSASVTVAGHLHKYQFPPADYLVNDGSKIPVAHLVASAAVVHSKHVLLLQRAKHSFQALLWELPGGRCETKDETVIVSAARELFEESGIVADKVMDLIGEYEWLDHGETWRKITFVMGVEKGGEGLPQVTLDPNEQNAFIWATEEDVMANKCGDVDLSFTSEMQKQTILTAFKLA
jgi:8-oxo-dGTP pyrophosphatase MutT (NUDIX family)